MKKIDYSGFLNKVKTELIKRIKRLNLREVVVSAYLYGGNIENILSGQALKSHEIDLLIVVSKNLPPGAPPVPLFFFNGFFNDFKILGHNILVIYNGVPPIGYDKNNILIDIIGDGFLNIDNEEPSSLLTALKPRYLLYGKDVYKPWENIDFTPNMIEELFKVKVPYVKREFFGRDDLYAQKAISKNPIFLASLLTKQTIGLNNNEDIIRIISLKYPELSNSLSFFWDSYKSDKLTEKSTIEKEFNNFCDFFKKISLFFFTNYQNRIYFIGFLKYFERIIN